MPLLLTGRAFREELERCGALALYAPLEGGAETRLLRRLRAAGYRTHLTSARGLGDPEAFLFQLHRVRPPPPGASKRGPRRGGGRGAAGDVYDVPQVRGVRIKTVLAAGGCNPARSCPP